MFDTLTRMGASAAGAYEIEKSLRFDSLAPTYLSRTPGSASNRKTWTFSVWTKRNKAQYALLFATDYQTSGTYGAYIGFVDDKLRIYDNISSSVQWHLDSEMLFRDYSSWYHIVVAVDTTQGTNTNRVKAYVNGTQISLTATTWPDQNDDGEINSTEAHTIGIMNVNGTADYKYDGYMADIHFADGVALNATNFGETHEDTGQWVPKKATGVTYGTNGFYLNFKDTSGTSATTLGKDQAGSNNWTPNNFSVSAGVGNDSSLDTPNNNFCTLNPAIGNGAKSGAVPSNGMLDLVGTDESTNRATFVFGPGNITSGKWYWEVTQTGGNTGSRPGLSGDLSGSQGSNSSWFRGGDVSWYSPQYRKDYTANMETTLDSYGDGDVIGIAYSADDDEVKYYKNGSLAHTDSTLPAVASNELHPVVFNTNSGANTWSVASINFGQRAFAHTPPTGYKKLCTKNLPEPTIVKPQDHFDVITYTGTATGSATQTISGLNFSPGLVWIKNRDVNYSHMLVDSTRGAGNWMEPNSNNTESSSNGYGNVTSFTSDGFVTTRGSSNGGRVNENGNDYVAWCWNTPTAFSNDASETSVGTMDSEGYINQTAGLSIQKWVAAVGGTFAHGLGVQGDILLQKNRDDSIDWGFTYDIVDGSWDYMFLNTTDDKGDTSQYVTSTTSQNSNGPLQNGDDNIAFTFSQVAGYSRFGKYRGNGNDDGPFIYTGFRPAWVMYKRTDADGKPWYINDSTRSPYNVIHNTTVASSNAVEQTSSNNTIDFYSNGWKVRKGATSTLNTDGGQFLYMAFAESPFKYANAR
mgnify:CR=1 FL=1|tara:strand:- start:98 stop:2506 length:2409 start_codon:yes stop_codon:yes gene_type:complete